MKKIFTLTLVFLAMMFSVNAQYLLQEGFETGTLPTGWTVVDNDGDSYTWDASFLYQSEGAAHTGDGMIASASYINNLGALTPDNWLISPAINMTAAADLTFWVKGQDASYASENYSVYVATSNTVAAFTATTAVLTGTTTGAWEQKTVNLSNFVGQTIYIAFRHHNTTDMYWLDLDDVEIFAQPTGPTISANPSTVNFGTAMLGNSANKTVNVTTYNLTSAVTATTAAPFSVSADGTTYGTSATIAAAGGTLYVQYTPTAVGSDNGTVTLSSTGASNVVVTLTGEALDCSNTTIPYSYNFDNEDMFNCWQIIDANNDGYTFNYGNGAAIYSYNTSNAANDWLISPEFTLTGSEMGSFDYWAGLASFPERFEVYALGADTVLLVSPVNVSNVSSNPLTQYFSLNLTGNYKIGIHCISDADQYRLYINNFSVFSGGTANITANPTEIDFGVLPTGNAISDFVDLTILNATEAITVSTAAPFAVSLDNTTFATSVTIPAPTSTVFTQTIYVSYNPTAAGTHNGQVTISTGNATATVTLSGTAIECGVITTFPFTETFDESSPTRECWTILDSNNDGYTYSMMAYSDDNPGCAVYFYNTNSNAEDWLISPEFTIPANGAFLSYDYVTSGSYEEKYSVWIIPENGTTTNAINILPTQTVMNAEFINNILNISSYANQTIRVAFKAESDADEYYLVFDNVTVDVLGAASLTVNPTSMYFSGLVNSPTAAKVANVTAMSLTSNITITTAAPFEVSTNGSNFATTATINQADIINTNIYVRYAPTTGGTQTGTVTLTSGSLTATINVSGTAVDCSGPQALPFFEGFESDLAECWQNIDNDGDDYYWESSLDFGIAGYEGDGCFMSASYDNNFGALTPDNWLITPALAIPSAGAKLTWYVAGQDPDWASEFYEVKLATSPNISTFTSVFSETLQSGDWEQRTVNIDGNWAGQTVYIAFQHHNSTDMYMMKIDNLNVTANVGVEDHELNATIYPNPANNVLNINANSNINNVEVYNMMGQMVGSYNVNDVNTQISTTAFANGVYTVRINTENGISTQKFTVAR